MSNTLTLANLTLAAQQRADMEGSAFVGSAEWTANINQSYQELYDILVQKYGDDYFATSSTITTDGVNQLFALPTDFQKALGIDLLLGNSPESWITIQRFNFSERNNFSVPNIQTAYGATNLRYRLNGNNLMLTPTPTSGQTVRVWYIPQLAPLANPSDTANNLGGWLEYVIVDAAIKALLKEESDVSALMAVKQGLLARIESAAENRDAGSPATVADSRGSDTGYPGDAGGYGSGGFF